MEGNFSAILKMIDEFGSCIFLHLICIKIHNGVCRHFDTYNKNYNSSYSHFIYTLMSLKNTEPVNPCQHLSLSLKSLQMHYHLGSFRIFKLLCGLKIQGGELICCRMQDFVVTGFRVKSCLDASVASKRHFSVFLFHSIITSYPEFFFNSLRSRVWKTRWFINHATSMEWKILHKQMNLAKLFILILRSRF